MQNPHSRSNRRPKPARKAVKKPQPEVVVRFLQLTTPIGPVAVRPMFGGHGFYFDGRIFAIHAFDEIWLKVDAETKPAFEAAGCRPFVYDGRNRPVEMPYWSLPEAAWNDGPEFQCWVERAFEAARRSHRSKRAG